MDADTAQPLDEITPAAQVMLTSLGCTYTKVSEVVESKNPEVYAAIKEGLDRANKDAISQAQRVSSIALHY